MKKSILLFALVAVTSASFAQKKLTTTSAIINFDATTSLDNLPKADNKTVVASIDPKTGAIAFEANIKSFSFSNPRMQEHFNNAGWMYSEKFPTATFKGKLANPSDVNFKKDGSYTSEVTGQLTMHGETNPVTSTATFVIKGKTITASTDFTVQLADYKINGGAVGAGKVAKDPKVSVTAVFN